MGLVRIDMNTREGYEMFIKVKSLPRYRFFGRMAEVPDEYMAHLGHNAGPHDGDRYHPPGFMFDYQADITRLACRKRKFAVFAAPGLGKSNIMFGFAQHALANMPADKCFLIVSPLMVIRQTIEEASKFFGDSLPLKYVRPRDLASWLAHGPGRIGITNYEAFKQSVPAGSLGGMALDESSLLKSAYGQYGRRLIEIGRGLGWKICLTGTPAPNDRIEYANHAVFLDAFPNVNSFLARYFVNRGQTDNRWEMKPHALRPFYRSLSDWCIFLQNPATYGWKDNVNTIPPVHVRIHDVPLTREQKDVIHRLGGAKGVGGITGRGILAQLAKGRYQGERIRSNKYEFIDGLIRGWRGNSTIVWCRYNHEQGEISGVLHDAVSISGDTRHEDRREAIRAFQAGEVPNMVTKPKVLGFGLNLQVASRQVFNGLWDSYEEYYQAVKRSNRIGSTEPLEVHIPVTPIERAMVDNVLRKAAMVATDAAEQEAIFKEVRYAG